MKQPEYTRWRQIDSPISPLDPIQPDSPKYVPGEIPAEFVVLLSDGGMCLLGPIRFANRPEASAYLGEHPEIKSFLVIPKP